MGFDELGIASRSAGVFVFMRPDDGSIFDQEPTGHSPRIADGQAESMFHGAQSRKEDAGTEQLAEGTSPQAKGVVQLSVLVRDGTRLGPAWFDDALPVLGGSEMDEHDLREAGLSCSLPELIDITPAERSSQVSEEDKQGR